MLRDLAYPSRFIDHLKPVPHELAVTLGRAFRGLLKPHTIRQPQYPADMPCHSPGTSTSFGK